MRIAPISHSITAPLARSIEGGFKAGSTGEDHNKYRPS